MSQEISQEAAQKLLAAAIDAMVEISALESWIRHFVPVHAVAPEDWARLHKPMVTTSVLRNLRAAIESAEVQP